MATENILHESEAHAVADIVRKHIAASVLDVAGTTAGLGPMGADDVPVLILPQGLTAQSVKKYLDEYRTAPERREGKAHLVELKSFVDHVNRFKDDDSALFAQPSQTQPTLMAVLDYHRKCQFAGSEGKPSTYRDGAPRFGAHRAIYPCPLSDEWKAWTAKNGQAMGQGEFASWLEDRIIDVADPDAAFASSKQFASALGLPGFAAAPRLLDLSRGLTVHVDERATTRVNPSTGETTVFYAAEHQGEDGAPLSLPRAFLIQIPVFRGGAAYQLPVRLKYRLVNGKMVWFYEIHNVSKAFDDAFVGACETAAEQTGLPLFYGSPEA